MPFVLPAPGFDYDALEPYIDARTMEIHYTKHFSAYLDNFNAAIKGTDLEDKSLSEIFSRVSQYPDAVRNNGGGYYNHLLFWQILTPSGKETMDIDLTDKIVKYFGTVENLIDEFSALAAGHFGSGWIWLIKKNNGELVITASPNQDNPLMDTVPIKGTPILCLDVWEHAYYLKYQNNRKAYIEAFWNLVNWNEVAVLFKNQHKI